MSSMLSVAAASGGGCGSRWDDWRGGDDALQRTEFTCGSSTKQRWSRSTALCGLRLGNWKPHGREEMATHRYCNACLQRQWQGQQAQQEREQQLAEASQRGQRMAHSATDIATVHSGYSVGARFHCSVCLSPPGFDLCAQCEESGTAHRVDHPLIRHLIPASPTVVPSSVSSVPAAPPLSPPALRGGHVERLVPDSALVSERTQLLVVGHGFRDGAAVRLAGRSCTDVTVLSESVLLCRTPAGLPTGDLTVTVSHPAWPVDAVLPDGFLSYLDPALSDPAMLQISSLEPTEGLSIGGTHLDITMRGLLPGAVSVAIGGVACMNAEVMPGGSTIRCMTGRVAQLPDSPSDVVVSNGGRSSTMPQAFRYLPAQDPSSARLRPQLDVVLVEPAEGYTDGNTAFELLVAGLLDDMPVTVTLGGLPCQVIFFEPGEATLYCQAAARDGPGAVDVVVSQAGTSCVLVRGFTYLPSPSFVSTAAVSPGRAVTAAITARQSARAVRALPAAVAVFRPYARSEAEAMARARERRLTGHTADFVLIDGVRVGILNCDVPRSQAEVYIVRDRTLAQRSGVRVGDSLSQEQLSNNANSDELLEALTDPRKVQLVREGLNPLYNAREISPREQAYVDHVRDKIRQRVAEKDRAGQRVTNSAGRPTLDSAGQPIRWHVGQHSYHGTVWVNPDWVPGHTYDSEQFSALMTAIAGNAEEAAVAAIVNIACNFDYQHAEAKRGFMDAFSFLFVNKQFPSEGLRQNYLHFVLRCGHIE